MSEIELAQRVHARRKEMGLSRVELARRAGVSPSLVARVELRGDVPKVRALTHLAGALELEPSELIGRVS